MPNRSRIVIGVSSLVVLLASLSLAFYRNYEVAMKAFKTWSMFSTAASSILLLSYFVITSAYNWRRQYRKSRQEQQRTAQAGPCDSELTDIMQRRASIVKAAIIPTRQPKELLSQIKIFQYVDVASLQTLTQDAQVRVLNPGQVLRLKRTEMAFVGEGAFKVSFRMGDSDDFSVNIGVGGTLTSYANALRALAKAYYSEKSVADRESCRIEAKEAGGVAIILDEKCFGRLVKASNLAVAHLAQVMLTRFKRATLPLLLNYFHLDSVMTAFLPYFLNKPASSSLKITDLIENQAKTEKFRRAVFSYLITSFGLDHTLFTAMEASSSLLAAHISIHQSGAGEVVQREGQECRGAFLILEGSLEVSFGGDGVKGITGGVGDFCGIISALMGKCSVVKIAVPEAQEEENWNASRISLLSTEAAPKCTFALISQHLLEMITERDPRLLFANIPSYSAGDAMIEFMDMCVDWQQRPCGSDVREGNADRVLKVLHGRVRESEKQREFGIGSFIGEDVIFSEKKETQVKFVAVRHSELATIPVALIEAFITKNSSIASTFLPRLLARQQAMLQEMTAAKRKIDPIKTICLLPVGASIRESKELDARARSLTINATRNSQMRVVEAVAEQLQAALTRHGVAWASIDSGGAAELMGRQLFTTLGTLKMNEYLAAQEDVCRLLIYVADCVFSTWTRQCIGQADLVLLVADLEDEVIALGDLERQMLHLNPLVNVEMCMARVNPATPSQTSKWLSCRPWIKAHHHLLLRGCTDKDQAAPCAEQHRHPWMPTNLSSFNISSAASLISMVPLDLLNSLIRKSRDLRTFLITQQQSLFQHRQLRRRSFAHMDTHYTPSSNDDFGRLARRLLGRSLGLVLGGGGARGIAHAGIIRAFQEAGLEFDLVGGTSIGAFVGALMSREQAGIARALPVISGFSSAMSSKWRQALDLTYPATSWFSGHAFNRALWKYFGFAGIEDYPVPFFAVTTDLTRSSLQIHRSGPAWQYIRASMSLSGFLPPVCDARDGTLLVDGGYLANVPIEQMLNGTMTELSTLTIGERARRGECEEETRDALAAAVTIAIDVGRATDRVPVYYGEALSGWTVIGRKLKLKLMRLFGLPLEGNVSVPLTLDEIQFRLAYASSAGLLSRTLRRSHVQLLQELDSSQNSYVKTCESTGSVECMPTVFYLRPTGVLEYGTLDFHKWDAIMRIGYEYGKRMIEAWREDGTLQRLLEMQGKGGNDVKTAEAAQSPLHDNCDYCQDSPNLLTIDRSLLRRRRSSI